jgi:hypothetical protein
MMTPTQILDLCEECATSIYGDRAPTPAYADRVARMLFGTAAQESNFQTRRQYGPDFFGIVGGFSMWQVEQCSVADSLMWLQNRPQVAVRAARFLWQDVRAEKDQSWLKGGIAIAQALFSLRFCDRWGVLMARLHYLRVAEPIPESAAGQAAYWKRHFNTVAGAGTVEQYLQNWNRLCLPVIERDE